MNYLALTIQLALAVVAVSCAKGDNLKRQVGQSANHETEEDRDVAETAFASAGLGAGKYFQYAHVPAKDHYEFGHRRGNDHHFNERHEKAHPHSGEFKTKVRWGDKHGGYGEHYWDFNHDGDGNDGEETQNEPQYAAYEASEQSPKYAGRTKRQPQEGRDVEFIDETARQTSGAGFSGRHGGNYRRAPDYGRAKRQDVEIRDLVYDVPTQKIVDQKTGKLYKLVPVSDA